MKYILYGKILSYLISEKTEFKYWNPQLILQNDLFEMKIELNKNLTLVEGTIQIIVAGFTSLEQVYEFDSVSNRSTFPINITRKFSQGEYSIQMYYQNPNSFEFRSIFSISPEYKMKFVGMSTIAYSDGSPDLFLTSKRTNTTLKLKSSNLSPKELKFVKCKLGDDYVTTYLVPNETLSFICEVYSAVQKNSLLSLWYQNGDALRNEFLLSDSLTCSFFGKLTLINNKIMSMLLLYLHLVL
jgi:hypothetical protein